MMRFRIVMILALAATTAWGQKLRFEKPDYVEIQRDIEDSTSQFYYPTLMDRYGRNDTTLTLQEYRHLYFGYTCRKAYDPSWRSEYAGILQEYYAKSTVTPKDCDTVIKYSLRSIHDFPFDLRDISMLAFAYHTKGDDVEADKWAYKAGSITRAIMSSGNGRARQTGLHVILTSHEYELMRTAGLSAKRPAVTIEECDSFEVEKNPYAMDVIYFNVGRIFDVMMKRKK